MFNSIGLFFNQIIDLERIAGLAKDGKIQWIAPLMAPDQSSVTHNRKHYQEWYDRLNPLGVKFGAWIVGDNPANDIDICEWIVNNYTTDALVLNCEKPYESEGKWKGKVLCEGLALQAATAKLPKLLSYPSTPAERFDMDYRAFQKIGCWFAPQAYWTDPTIESDATPENLFMSTYLPGQCHVGRDYRLWINGKSVKPWGRVIQKLNDTTVLIKNLATNEKYNTTVITKHEGTYEYMVFSKERILRSKKNAIVGKVLGFCERDKIVPTVGIYDPKPPVAQITEYLREIPQLKGASGYLGDTSDNTHVHAIYDGVHR